MCASEHAPRDPFRVFELIHSRAEIVERGAVVLVERHRVRILGESKDITLRMRWNYARALYNDDASTLDDLREAVNTLGETAVTARRVLGGAHPLTKKVEGGLRESRAALRAREDSV